MSVEKCTAASGKFKNSRLIDDPGADTVMIFSLSFTGCRNNHQIKPQKIK